jgi:hypothetical protein
MDNNLLVALSAIAALAVMYLGFTTPPRYMHMFLTHVTVNASTDILLSSLDCSKFTGFPRPTLFVQEVVKQIKSMFVTVEDALLALSNWLALFPTETNYTNEVLDTYKWQLVVGLRCNKLYNRMPNTITQHLAIFREKTYPELRRKYRQINPWAPEVFYFHHGLRYLDNRVKAKLKDKDFLDIGAFNGDSALVLSEYGRSTSISPRNQ